ncbi:hypothetical protein CAC42_5783 [Sphaceloma murrayae]|uniref:Zn(2)-C6 fungal-type domain-containing protein n=1 Tax=Sphaceloma murrayae TaxID=2082308 RepID=A0A2K1QZI4_9PEZI|nr:hypothetical protein CAC42_5783 [Sphaceloma murrayae]
MSEARPSPSKSPRTQTETGGPPGRITQACLACRSRKQKCNGAKPQCLQCQDSRRRCEWPQVLKRGPLKGHAELLESRLIRTEELLVRTLSLLDEEKINQVFDNPCALDQAQDSAIIFEKPDAAYWSEFNLDSPDNMRMWWSTKMCRNRKREQTLGTFPPPSSIGTIDGPGPMAKRQARESVSEGPSGKPFLKRASSSASVGPGRAFEQPVSSTRDPRNTRDGKELDQNIFW